MTAVTDSNFHNLVVSLAPAAAPLLPPLILLPRLLGLPTTAFSTPASSISPVRHNRNTFWAGEGRGAFVRVYSLSRRRLRVRFSQDRVDGQSGDETWGMTPVNVHYMEAGGSS